MNDITHKFTSLRTARAMAKIFFSESTRLLVAQNAVAKGNVYEFAKAAALMAAKKTWDLLPHCHPIPIESMQVFYEDISEGALAGILIEVEVKTIARTGIEMEAMTGATVAALTMYDMLKPYDKELKITDVALVAKEGGKSGHKYFNTAPNCAVLVCSNSTYAGKREDKSGKTIVEMLRNCGIEEIAYEVVADDKAMIKESIAKWIEHDVAYIFTTGGTGLSPHDLTVDAVKELIDREAPGIVEAMRAHGQARTPLAMMSRMVAGTKNYSTIVTLPGSTNGVKESLEAILPAIFHARKMLKGGGH